MDRARLGMDVFQADLSDSDVATAQTIGAMCEHVHRAAQDPLVARAAHHAEACWGAARPSALMAARFGLSAGESPGAGCFWWAKHHVKMLPHSKFKALVAAYEGKRQLLIVPGVVLRAPNPAGDCSTFSMLIASMLEALGISWEFVTVAVEPSDPSIYSHVFVRAVLPDGGRITLDGSHGKSPGWEVPRAHQFRRQVWDSTGEAIDDQAPVVSQLHEYRRRGLGDDTTDLSSVFSDITDTSSPTFDTSVDTSAFGASMSSGGDYVMEGSDGSLYSGPSASGPWTLQSGSTPAAGSLVAPSGGTNTAAWTAFANALNTASKGAMTLAEINAIQPGTVVGANGAILRQATGLPVPVGTGITAALGSSSSTILLLGAAALLLVFVMMGNKH